MSYFYNDFGLSGRIQFNFAHENKNWSIKNINSCLNS